MNSDQQPMRLRGINVACKASTPDGWRCRIGFVACEDVDSGGLSWGRHYGLPDIRALALVASTALPSQQPG